MFCDVACCLSGTCLIFYKADTVKEGTGSVVCCEAIAFNAFSASSNVKDSNPSFKLLNGVFTFRTCGIVNSHLDRVREKKDCCDELD